MLVIASLVLNKLFFYFELKKIIIFFFEVVFLIIAILQKDLSWLFSFNLPLFWYPIAFLFWSNWLQNLIKFKNGKWPIFLFFGVIKSIIYIGPFLGVLIGQEYAPNTIFRAEAGIFGVIVLTWILILNFSKNISYFDQKK